LEATYDELEKRYMELQVTHASTVNQLELQAATIETYRLRVIELEGFVEEFHQRSGVVGEASPIAKKRKMVTGTPVQRGFDYGKSPYTPATRRSTANVSNINPEPIVIGTPIATVVPTATVVSVVEQTVIQEEVVVPKKKKVTKKKTVTENDDGESSVSEAESTTRTSSRKTRTATRN